MSASTAVPFIFSSGQITCSIVSKRIPHFARLRALQLDSARTTAGPGQLRGRSNRTVSPARRQHVVTGPGSYALLTMVALMGAADRAGVTAVALLAGGWKIRVGC